MSIGNLQHLGGEGFIWESERKENDYTLVKYDLFLQTWDTKDIGGHKSFSGRNFCGWLYLKDFYNKYITKKKLEYE